MRSRLVLAIGLFVSVSSAMEYSGGGAAAYAQVWANWRKLGHDGFKNYFDGGGNCCKFVSRAMTKGGGVKFWGVREEVLERQCYREHNIEPDKEKFKDLLDNENHFYWIPNLRQCLSEWQVPVVPYSIDQLKAVPASLQVGDLIFVHGHVMIVVAIDRQKGVIYFADHHGRIKRDKFGRVKEDTRGFFKYRPLVKYLIDSGWSGCEIAHMPSWIRDCMDLKQVERWDSTFGRARVRHQWVCCWHERLGGQSPWISNPTPYACLSWTETRGTTWDTLISPRVNLAGCSSVVLVQACTSNLLHGLNKTIEVRCSTDDGATWPYLLGNDRLTQASLPWATNQRKVRIAWIYKGPVQPGRFWCVDEVRVLAKPTRYRDVCVSEIRKPNSYGNIVPILSPSAVVRPTAFLWNTGRQDETLSVTLKIGASYTDTRTMILYPYYDTSVEFTPWTATPGSYTATCYSDLTGDEFSSNDTATLNFKVAADTWIKMFPVYNGGVQTGACITSTGQETLFCVTGRSKFFASYLISQDL